ncbi:phage tail tube protein [Tritonibacter mobilis]|uniref:phage tail tube protein n=1 Tax=Tritonibacter mobilis TaxID=379347 RepID=UPI0039A5F64B
MPRAQGARAQMALGFETVYGMPPAANSFWKMPFASTNLGSDQPLLNSELLGYGRDPLPPVKDAITADGDVAVPLDPRFLAIWFKALMGDPTTTGASAPYSHEFQTGGWTLPSMSVEVGHPEVPLYSMVSGVVANSITWNMQRSGLVTATVACVAQGETDATSSSAGTLEELDLTRFGSFNGAIKREGSLLANVVSGSVTYTNNLDRVETIRADGKIDGADPSVAALTGEIVVRFADTVLRDQAEAGDPCELEFSYVKDAANSMTLTAHAVYLPRPRKTVEGPGGVQATYAWQAALDPITGRMASVTIVNDMADLNNPT